MKKLLLVALLFISSNCVIGQTNTPILEFRYQFTYVDDTNHRDQPFKEQTLLYVTPEWSVYLRDNSIGSAAYFFTEKGGKIENFNPLNELNEMGSYIQLFTQKQSVYTEKILNLYYQIQEPLETIEWTIHEDKKQISGFEGQKATAQVRGRHYTAWFCSELPYQAGPWKLNGLPGLIIAAEDQEAEVIFELLGVEQSKLAIKEVKIPTNVQLQKVKQQDFNKVYKQFMADPTAFAKAALGGNVVMGASATGGGNRVAKKWNNPIEK